MEVQYIQVTDILVLDRLRKDMGNMERLAESLKEKEMINPIIVTPNLDSRTNRKQKWLLLCGHRRLIAARDILGWKAVPAECRLCWNARDMLFWEASENTLLQYSDEEVKDAPKHFAIVKRQWEEMVVIPTPEISNPFKLTGNHTESSGESVIEAETGNITPDREKELQAEIDRLRGELDECKAQAERMKARYEQEIEKILDENVSLRIRLEK